MSATGTPLVEVGRLGVTFRQTGEPVEAVRDVSFTIDAGESVALVGESGSGKSVTALSILQLLPYPLAAHTAGSSIRYRGEELLGAPRGRLQRLRGNEVSMVFQEPMTSLNPLHTVEKQIAETLRLHRGLAPRAARDRAVELLDWSASPTPLLGSPPIRTSYRAVSASG